VISLINLEHFTKRLAKNAETIRSLVEDISEEQARWKPDPEKWSILEVINHLYDEEREDFRTRLDFVLHHPDQPFPGINPAGWVIERQYNTRDLAESLQKFLQERKHSISWLEGLSPPDWNTQHTHPQFGSISAGTFMASWVVHDFLSIRQLAGLHRLYIAHLAGESHPIDYAGIW